MVVDKGHLRTAILMVRAINHKFRQRIISVLYESHKTVTELTTELGAERSHVSQQLAILRRAKVVSAKRRKKKGKRREVEYHLNRAQYEHIKSVAKELSEIDLGN